jgi:hypothetical protein
MNAKCERCPCPDTCLSRPSFCQWAAEEPQNPVRIDHICNRSRMAVNILGIPRETIQSPVVTPIPSTITPIPTPRSTVPANARPCGSCGPPRHPSLATQVGTAMRSTVGWVAGGMRLATKETQAERRAICNGCEFHDTKHDKCIRCGCWLRMKLRLINESCPENKWGREA